MRTHWSNLLKRGLSTFSGFLPPNICATKAVCCADLARAYVVSGSRYQPSINGIYVRTSEAVHGHSYYTKRTGTDTRVLYWTPTSGGNWCMGSAVGKGYRAIEPDGSSPTFGPPQSPAWKAWGENKKMVQESSITVSQQGAQSTLALTSLGNRFTIRMARTAYPSNLWAKVKTSGVGHLIISILTV